MSESEIQTAILLALGARPDVRLFRQNVAQGWVGRLVRRLPDGSVLLANARPLHAGLVKGSGDLLGWISRGDPKQAVFLSLEVKTATGRASPEQLIWRENVLKAGGIAGVVRSVEDAEALCR